MFQTINSFYCSELLHLCSKVPMSPKNPKTCLKQKSILKNPKISEIFWYSPKFLLYLHKLNFLSAVMFHNKLFYDSSS